MADELNFQIPQQGFDSYLYGIIPDDQAVLAGALSVSMQQVRNIEKVQVKDFAKVAYSMESTVGLPLTAGTDIPTDTPLSTAAKIKTALGSGVYGTYTMSNFFGAMSGLPYPWVNTYEKILQLQTTKLQNIYQELYLAVQWEGSQITITQSTPYNIEVQPYIPPDPMSGDPGQPRIDNWYYTVDFTLVEQGGGYSRGTAPAPTVTFSPNNCGASATVVMNTDVDSVGSNGGGLYGRITGFATKNVGTAYLYDTTSVSDPSPPSAPTPPVEYVTIQTPPTATLAVQTNGDKATGGTNTSGIRRGSDGSITVLEPGWPNMNDVVGSMDVGSEKGYIKQANDEIQAITTRSAENFNNSKILNALWNIYGIALKHEQRARYVATPPVPVPWDNRVSSYPTAMYVFVDSIPDFAKETQPHEAAQTLEHISDLLTTGGQSTIAMMRQERNQDRLQEIGIELDNNLGDKLSVDLEKKLMTNGVLPGAVEGIESPDGNIYTIPSWPEDTTPIVYTSVDPVTPGRPTNNLPITDGIIPSPEGIPGGPNVPPVFVTGIPTGVPVNNTRQIIAVKPGTIEPILNGDPNPIVNPKVPVGVGPFFPEPPINIFVNEDPLPPEINADFTGTPLKPSTYDINDAIDKVIECNCDCWVN
jgi:hypothetical protein